MPSGALDVNFGDCLKLLGALLAAWATVSHSGRFRARPSQTNFPGNSPGRFCLLSYITSFDKFQFSRSLKATGHAGPRVCDCLARWLPGPWPARACCAIRNRGLDRRRVCSLISFLVQKFKFPTSRTPPVMLALALATFSHAGCQGLHWAARLLTVSILMTVLRFFLRRYLCMYTNIDMYTNPIRNFSRVSRHPHGFLKHSFQIRNH